MQSAPLGVLVSAAPRPACAITVTGLTVRSASPCKTIAGTVRKTIAGTVRPSPLIRIVPPPPMAAGGRRHVPGIGLPSAIPAVDQGCR